MTPRRPDADWFIERLRERAERSQREHDRRVDLALKIIPAIGGVIAAALAVRPRRAALALAEG